MNALTAKRRNEMVIWMQGNQSTPKEVAALLEKLQTQGVSVEPSEIRNLKSSNTWARANRYAIGPRFANTEEPSDPMWVSPGRWIRRDVGTPQSSGRPLPSIETDFHPELDSTLKSGWESRS